MFLSLERAFVACTVASGELDFEPAGEINRGVSENPGSRIGLSFTFPVPVRDHYQLKLSGSLVRHYLWLQVISGWLLSATFVAGLTGLMRSE